MKGSSATLLLIAAGCVATAQAQQHQFRDMTFVELVRNPSAAKRDLELRAYLQGMGRVIRSEHVCSDQEERALEDPDMMIDALVQFSKTAWGDFFLTTKATLGSASWDHSTGDALYSMYVEHSHCLALPPRKSFGATN